MAEQVRSWSIRFDADGVSADHAHGTKIRLSADGSVNDGYHTFEELYRHRALLTAALFSSWHYASEQGLQEMHVHKSRLHSDRTELEGFFIVMAELPTGQISYHYPDADWDLFEIPEREYAELWDGHTSADVLDRLERYLRPE